MKNLAIGTLTLTSIFLFTSFAYGLVYDYIDIRGFSSEYIINENSTFSEDFYIFGQPGCEIQNPIQWEILSGPSWLSINPTGYITAEIEGTAPTVNSTQHYSVTINAYTNRMICPNGYDGYVNKIEYFNIHVEDLFAEAPTPIPTIVPLPNHEV